MRCALEVYWGCLGCLGGALGGVCLDAFRGASGWSGAKCEVRILAMGVLEGCLGGVSGVPWLPLGRHWGALGVTLARGAAVMLERMSGVTNQECVARQVSG